MLSAVPTSVAEILVLAPFVLLLSAIRPLDAWAYRMIALMNGRKVDAIEPNEYIIIAAAVIYVSFIVAAFTEGTECFLAILAELMIRSLETLKFLLGLLVKRHRPLAKHPYTVVLYVTMGALGFATLENFSYILQSAVTGTFADVLVNAVERAVLSVPMHAITGLLIGSKMATLPQVPTDSPSFNDYLRMVWLPILLHGSFDVIAFVGAILGGWYQFIYLLLLILLGFGGYKAYRDVKDILSLPEYDNVR